MSRTSSAVQDRMLALGRRSRGPRSQTSMDMRLSSQSVKKERAREEARCRRARRWELSQGSSAIAGRAVAVAVGDEVMVLMKAVSRTKRWTVELIPTS